MKCRFCLTNHLGSDATSTNESASTTILGIVHPVVESTTFYGAVAKGGAAANLLSANEAEPAVDGYTLIYDLEPRTRCAVTEEMSVSLLEKGGRYEVQSASGNRYEVDVIGESRTCPDW